MLESPAFNATSHCPVCSPLRDAPQLSAPKLTRFNARLTTTKSRSSVLTRRLPARICTVPRSRRRVGQADQRSMHFGVSKSQPPPLLEATVKAEGNRTTPSPVVDSYLAVDEAFRNRLTASPNHSMEFRREPDLQIRQDRLGRTVTIRVCPSGCVRFWQRAQTSLEHRTPVPARWLRTEYRAAQNR
jgi:hypothetical protein